MANDGSCSIKEGEFFDKLIKNLNAGDTITRNGTIDSLEFAESLLKVFKDSCPMHTLTVPANTRFDEERAASSIQDILDVVKNDPRLKMSFSKNFDVNLATTRMVEGALNTNRPQTHIQR